MAGEITKSANLTTHQGGRKIKSPRKEFTVIENEAITTGELEAADSVIYNIDIPSSAVLSSIEVINDDLDSDGSPAVTLDVGLFAGENFTSVTSSTETEHDEDDILDVDLFVDGATTLQSATTKWTLLDYDTTTNGADDQGKELWEMLGYDSDPQTKFRVGVTFAAAAATAAAGDLALKVKYLTE